MKGFRTIIFNVIMTAGAIITTWTGIDTTAEVTQLKEGVDNILIGGSAAWGAGNVLLRMITNTAIFKKS